MKTRMYTERKGSKEGKTREAKAMLEGRKNDATPSKCNKASENERRYFIDRSIMFEL